MSRISYFSNVDIYFSFYIYPVYEANCINLSVCSLPFLPAPLFFNSCLSHITVKFSSTFKYIVFLGFCIINSNDLLSWSGQVLHESKNKHTLKFV